jgi:inner membrane protein involved in colicin E2 resistance
MPLLMGVITLFVVLVAVMSVTRGVDRYTHDGG